MKKSIFILAVIVTSIGTWSGAQCDVEITVENQSITGSTMSFDVVMRSNIGPIRLADSDFTIVDGDDQSNFGSATVSLSNALPGAEAAGNGTRYIINYTVPPAFAAAIDDGGTRIATVRVSDYQGGSVELQWSSAIVHHFSSDQNVQRSLSTCRNIASAMPVDLTYFLAENVDTRSVTLEWETASESNNEGFEIQHSIDGLVWQPVTFVEGQGLSLVSHAYSFLHSNAAWGRNYYRLKQMDFDGSFEYSDIRIVEIESSSVELAVFPNPTVNYVNVVLPDNTIGGEIHVFDQQGRLLISESITPSIDRHQLQMGHLPKATYTVRIIQGEMTAAKQVIVH